MMESTSLSVNAGTECDTEDDNGDAFLDDDDDEWELGRMAVEDKCV